MIRYFSTLTLCCIGLLVFAQGNDLYSVENSKKFATYLFKSGNYNQAAIEYERLVLTDSLNSFTYKHKALVCYRKSNNLKTGLNRFNKWFKQKENLTYPLNKEFSLYLTGSYLYNDAIAYLQDCKDIAPSELSELLALNHCYLLDWQNAKANLDKVETNSITKEVLTIAVNKGLKMKTKKPGLAATLSIIPGLGRIYTGNYIDAGLSALTIGTFGWQAYTGFNKNGIKSAYGWLTGGVAAGFYFGNIYGSYRAAQLQNKQKLDEILFEVDRAFKLLS
ncbi:MAG: hypothetical protein ACPGLV_11750 [Bacteroidia bacterium]